MPRFWARFLLAALLIITAAVAVYNPSLRGPFIFDDLPKIVENPDIKEWDRIWSTLVYPYDEAKSFKRNDPSRPVVYLTLAWNYRVGGLNPFGYRLFNVLVHAANALLLMALVHVIWLAVYRRRVLALPMLAGLLFALHPLNTSTVSYVFSRSDVLSTFFYLLSLLLFAAAFAGARRNYAAFAVSLLCFPLAFYAKQLAATLPAVLLFFDYVVMSRFRRDALRPRLAFHAAYWALLALMLIGRLLYFGALGDLEAKTPLPAGPYFMTQAFSVAKYLQMALAPVGMCIDHAVSVSKTFFAPPIILSWLLLLVIFAAFVHAWRARTDAATAAVFFLGWCAITLAPTSSFLPTTAVIVDNRAYLPALGWVGMLVLGYAALADRARAWPAPARALPLLLAVLHLGILGALCANRNGVFRSEQTVWEDVIRTYPENPRARTILAALYSDQGEEERAIAEYLRVIALDPNRPNVHNNLASLYYKRREVDKAIAAYLEEIRLSPDEPLVRRNLANAYYSQRQYPQAIAHYRKAIALEPENAKTYFELGTLYLECKEYAEATALLEQARALDPGDPGTLNNLGVAYLHGGEARKALDTFTALRAVDPHYAGAVDNANKARRALGLPEVR